VLCQLEVWEVSGLNSFGSEQTPVKRFSCSLSLFLFLSLGITSFSMAYRQPRTNIRRSVRRRAPARRSASVRRTSRRRAPTRRRISSRARAPQRPCKCPGELSPGDRFIVAQADPFEPKANGAKIPDSATIPSIGTPVQYNYTLTTSAASQVNWASAWAFLPSPSKNAVAAVGLSPNTWDWATAPTVSSIPNLSGFQSQFEGYRTVAHGIRLSCPFAPTTAQGFVHIALATESNYTTSGGAAFAPYTQLAANLSDLSNYTFYKRVTLASLTQSPLTLINKWMDETAFRYQSPMVATSDASTTGSAQGGQVFHFPGQWGMLVVAVEGIASGSGLTALSPLTAEVLMHYECIPNKASTLIGSTAAPFDAATMGATSRAVGQTDFAHTEAQQGTSQRSFANELMDAAGVSESDVYNAARSIGRHAVRLGVNYVAGQIGIGGVNNNANRLSLM